MDIVSSMLLNQWVGALSLLSSFYNTRPVDELVEQRWRVICHAIAPGDVPANVKEKEYGPYFVGCLFKSVQLVGKTLEAALAKGLPVIGKMRSISHVTTTTMIAIDLDGLTKKQLKKILKRLRGYGLTFLCYSTHSFGRSNKPGFRCRIVMPVDQELNATEYVQALKGSQKLLFDGLADENAFTLAQAQGVWMAPLARTHLAFRIKDNAGVIRAQALINAAPIPSKSKSSAVYGDNTEQLFIKSRVEAAICWLDMSGYGGWFDVSLWLKAAYGEAARQLWKDHSDSEGKYDLDDFWDSLPPRMPAGAGAGLLFGAARDRVIEVIRECSRTDCWSEEGKRALIYLKQYHGKKYAEMFGEAA